MSYVLFILLGLGCFLYVLIHDHSLASRRKDPTTTVNVFIDGTKPIAETDDVYVCATLDWWPPQKCDYGTCSWGRASLLNLDLNNRILLNAVNAISPLKIRLGGTLQDNVRYETSNDVVKGRSCGQFTKNQSHIFGFNQGCMSLSRWDKLNAFFKQTGVVVTFGLNALTGRTIDSSGEAVGAWDSSNAESLIRHTVDNNYSIHGWELGNELSAKGVGARIAAYQYAADMKVLKDLVDESYDGHETKPLLIGPGGFFDANWFTEFVSKARSSVQAVTHHIYNLGAGVNPDLVEKILDPSYLDGEAGVFGNLQRIINSSRTSAVAWVGEAGGAYNSGHDLVTNAFIISFWYLDQLGMAASHNTKTYCRQSLIGGNYGLLNTTSFHPNPDYYSALLWHRLMGKQVLSMSSSWTNKLRAYAHCSKQPQGITLLFLNLDGKTRLQVSISIETGLITLQHDGSSCTYKDKRIHYSSLRAGKLDKTVGSIREEYHLKADNGDLQSQTVQLNGKALAVNSAGEIPALEPVIVMDLLDPVVVDPLSIVFVQISSIAAPACQ